MKISAENSNRIKTISVIATFLVIALHTPTTYLPSSLSWYFKTVFEHGLCRMAVPFFFAVSGFFMAAHCTESGWWKRCVTKRLQTIGIPYLFWSFLWWLFVFGLVAGANVAGHRPVFEGADFSWRTPIAYLGLDLTRYPGFGVFWYLRTLILMAILSPISICIVRKTKWMLPAVMFVANLAVFSLGDQSALQKHVLVLDLEGVTYFMVGLALALHGAPFMLSRRGGLLVLLMGIVLSGFYPCLFSTILPNEVIGTIVIPLAMLGLWFGLPAIDMPGWLTRNTFPVYILHPFVIKLTMMGHCDLTKFGFAGFLMYVALVFLICVAGTEILRRTSTRFAGIVFGGR